MRSCLSLPLALPFVVAVCVLGADAPSVAALPPTAFGPEGVAAQSGVPLAPAPAASGRPVQGVECGRPTTAYHVHTHLAIYVDGAPRLVPATIGMVGARVRQTATGAFYDATTCYYQLHTHAQDGVIYVEAPGPTTFTLGQFFALWQQPLDSDRVGPAQGEVTVYVNGDQVAGDPAGVPLTNRSVIQIDVGERVAPQPVSWLHF